METQSIRLFQQFKQSHFDEDLKLFQELILASGYSLFSKFIDAFRDSIRTYDEPEAIDFPALIEKARNLFPTPIQFSPHWQSVWDEFQATVEHKNSLFVRIPPAERDGEWQVILDNPYTNQEVVCYPALPFIEAAYLYGYFRPELKENEYIRIQKVQNCIVEFGSVKSEKSSVL